MSFKNLMLNADAESLLDLFGVSEDRCDEITSKLMEISDQLLHLPGYSDVNAVVDMQAFSETDGEFGMMLLALNHAVENLKKHQLMKKFGSAIKFALGQMCDCENCTEAREKSKMN